MTKLLVVGNWKCNPVTLKEAKKLFNLIEKGIKNIKKVCPGLSRRVEVVICPSFLYLPFFVKKGITIGSQDVFWEERGAFTGEVSPAMLKNLGCQYVIIGHSERRKYFRETDEMINKKIKAALKAKLKPILCIENLSQLKGVSRNTIVAYEPVFAISSGKPCSIEKAKRIRKRINNNFVLYGGSVISQNAKDYIEKAGFQGLLIGNASLNPKEFTKIVRNIALISKNC